MFLRHNEWDAHDMLIVVSHGGQNAAPVEMALAGSTLTLDQAVRNMVDYTGVTWANAIEMATATPARIADIDARKGRLAPGYDADIVALDAQGHLLRTWTRGALAYSAESAMERMS